jgi:hypothetical protein
MYKLVRQMKRTLNEADAFTAKRLRLSDSDDDTGVFWPRIRWTPFTDNFGEHSKVARAQVRFIQFQKWFIPRVLNRLTHKPCVTHIDTLGVDFDKDPKDHSCYFCGFDGDCRSTWDDFHQWGGHNAPSERCFVELSFKHTWNTTSTVDSYEGSGLRAQQNKFGLDGLCEYCAESVCDYFEDTVNPVIAGQDSWIKNVLLRYMLQDLAFICMEYATGPNYGCYLCLWHAKN